MNIDLLIKQGWIIDGTGNPWYKSDIGIKEEKVEFIGNKKSRFSEKIDASGLIVSPGFIDIHGHSDYTVLIDPRVESKIMQGVTTEVSGNCGQSPAPMNIELKKYREKYSKGSLPEDFTFNWSTVREYFREIEKKGTSFNVISLVGQGTVRQNVMKMDDRKPSEKELELMKELVAQAMKDGVFGMSSGLATTPCCYSDTNELVELAKVVAKYNGIYFCHIRGEGDNLIEALNESITIAEKSGVILHIPHFKASGKRNWGKTKESLKIVELARDRGIDLTFDQYPYIASSISLSALLPPWVHEGGVKNMITRLQDEDIRKKIKNEPGRLTQDLESVMISFAKNEPNYEGMKVTEIGELENKDPMDVVFDILLIEKGQASMVVFGMSEEDVRRVMKSPYMMVSSDGKGISPIGILGKGKPHPRYYGSFPRVLGYYVKEGVLSLQEAIRKMTSAPAQRLGLRDRGLLREGYKADITIFNPKKIKDNSTFKDPHKFPSGIDYVLVNGRAVVEKGKHTGELPGRVLRKNITYDI